MVILSYFESDQHLSILKSFAIDACVKLMRAVSNGRMEEEEKKTMYIVTVPEYNTHFILVCC